MGKSSSLPAGRLEGISQVLRALGGCSAPSPSAWLPQGPPCQWVHLVQHGIGLLRPFTSPMVSPGRHECHRYSTWCSHASYRIMDPDVPTGFSYMSMGGGLGPGTGRAGNVAKEGCAAAVQGGPACRRAQGLYGAMWKPTWAVHGGLLTHGDGSVGWVVEGTRALWVCALVGMLSHQKPAARRGRALLVWAGGAPALPGCRTMGPAWCLCLCWMNPVHFSATGLPIFRLVSHGQTGFFLPCNGQLGQNSSLPDSSNSVFLFSVIANKLPRPQGIPAWLLARDLGAAGFPMPKGTLSRIC